MYSLLYIIGSLKEQVYTFLNKYTTLKMRNLYNMRVLGERLCVKYTLIFFSCKLVNTCYGLDVIQDRVHLRIFMVIAKSPCIL